MFYLLSVLDNVKDFSKKISILRLKFLGCLSFEIKCHDSVRFYSSSIDNLIYLCFYKNLNVRITLHMKSITRTMRSIALEDYEILILALYQIVKTRLSN